MLLLLPMMWERRNDGVVIMILVEHCYFGLSVTRWVATCGRMPSVSMPMTVDSTSNANGRAGGCCEQTMHEDEQEAVDSDSGCHGIAGE